MLRKVYIFFLCIKVYINTRMDEDPYKEYRLWQKNLSIEYQNKLAPMWNRLITFNNREYGIIGFFYISLK